jgi:hypothetical protein
MGRPQLKIVRLLAATIRTTPPLDPLEEGEVCTKLVGYFSRGLSWHRHR